MTSTLTPSTSPSCPLLPVGVPLLMCQHCNIMFAHGHAQEVSYQTELLVKATSRCAAANAGELSPGLAWVLCIGLAVAGLTITATNFGRPITLLYACGLFLGTIYRSCL